MSNNIALGHVFTKKSNNVKVDTYIVCHFSGKPSTTRLGIAKYLCFHAVMRFKKKLPARGVFLQAIGLFKAVCPLRTLYIV